MRKARIAHFVADAPTSLPFENCLHNLCYPHENRRGEDLTVQHEAKGIFLSGLKLVGRLLSDLPTRTSGPIEAANRYLVVRSINDLLVAFHATCCGYYTQAHNLLRPVIESYNLITLFKKDPSKITPWLDGGETARKQLSAVKVRNTLYNKSEDPFESLYSYLCEVGSHPRFAGSKTSLVRTNPLNGGADDTPQLIAFIGGRRLQPFHSVNIILCLIMILPLLLAFLEIYPINDGDIAELLKHLKNILEFGKQHFPDVPKRDIFNKMLENLDSLVKEIPT